MALAPGMNASSSTGENGTGARGGVVAISIGPRKLFHVTWATWAETSAAMLQRGCASSMHTRWPVFSTSFHDCVKVERRQGSQVDHVRLDALPRERCGGVHGSVDHHPVRDQADVVALADDIRLPERDGVTALQDVPLQSVEPLVLAEDHRVGVPDRLDEQALGVVRGARADDLEATNVREERRQRLQVLRRCAKPGADHRPDDDWGLGLASKHVAELGGLVEDLVEADAHEVDEHQFGDRA